MKAHFVTIEGTLPSGEVTANCGAIVKYPTAVDILEPGTDRVLVIGPRDCRKCAEAENLKARHYLYRIVSGEADKRYLGRSGE